MFQSYFIQGLPLEDQNRDLDYETLPSFNPTSFRITVGSPGGRGILHILPLFQSYFIQDYRWKRAVALGIGNHIDVSILLHSGLPLEE